MSSDLVNEVEYGVQTRPIVFSLDCLTRKQNDYALKQQAHSFYLANY